MVSNYIVTGRGDLDALFLARSSAKRADVGFYVAGVDVSNRWEPRGAATPIAATGFYAGGTDLANLFRSAGAPLLSVSLSPASINTTANPTALVTATVSSGSGNYNFTWVRQSGDTRITATTASASTTRFQRSGFAVDETGNAVFRVFVQDTVTLLQTTADISVTMTRVGAGP